MKYIVTKDDGDTQRIKPVEHNSITAFAFSDMPNIIINGHLGQYFVIDKKTHKSVPEDTNKPNIYKTLCIGADIIPDFEHETCKKHLVLFNTKIGDLHYDVDLDDSFFSTQFGHELLLQHPKDIDFNSPNKGFKIIKNITIDDKRTDFVLKNQNQR